MSMQLYHSTSQQISKLITTRYSTSFSLGIRMLKKHLQYPVYAIYGFVRYADEIVDTFHEYNKPKLLTEFKNHTYQAIDERISMNPVLHSFQQVVHQYNIEKQMIEDFLVSMEMDLHYSEYSRQQYEKYIYGSAEVVGLMCLKVFCNGNQQLYEELVEPARKLGDAFQKINFLRDISSDYKERGRVYFPNLKSFTDFNHDAKKQIEADVQKDFEAALIGIKRLDPDARFGVYLAYSYYIKLFKKIKKVCPNDLIQQRLRIPDSAKLLLLFTNYLKNKMGLI